MKRICGFSFFLIAIGMLLSLFLQNEFIEVIIIIVLLLAGYNLFCCGCKCR